MANFAAIHSTNEKALPLVPRSSDLDAQTAAPVLNCAKDASFYAGVKGGSGLVSVASWSVAGTKLGMFDACLFERIIVVPRSKALGFVLSTVTFAVEVWNTFQSTERVMSSINTGGAGVTVANPYGTPLSFGPSRSVFFTTTVSQDGPAVVSNVVTFVFNGGITGADMTLSGSRLTVFSVEIDWSGGFEETIAYLTNIIPAYSAAEQRVSLRTKPRYGATYIVATLNAKDSAAMDAVLHSWQARVYGVPWWMDASPLLANVSAGANTISVDTTNRQAFAVGELGVIWKDQHNWEAFTIQTLSTGSITTTTPLNGNWSAGVQVIPVKRGRLSDLVTVKRESSTVASFKPTFECEVV